MLYISVMSPSYISTYKYIWMYYIYASFHIVNKRVHERGNCFSCIFKASLNLKYVFMFNQMLFYVEPYKRAALQIHPNMKTRCSSKLYSQIRKKKIRFLKFIMTKSIKPVISSIFNK